MTRSTDPHAASSDPDLLVRVLDGDEDALARFSATRPPLEVVSVIASRVFGLYGQVRQNLQPLKRVVPLVRRLVAASDHARRRAGVEQRAIDLHLMRVFRQSGALCAVLGAGVTMDAGGPSWAGLVRRLLATGLERGFEDVRTVPPDELRFTDLLMNRVETVTGYRSFDDAQRRDAQHILSAIAEHRADTDMLMRGAQMCFDTGRQRLFANVADILYGSAPRPGPIHRTVAELAEPIALLGPGDRKAFGWSGLITYNFDDLMGEALDERRIPRVAWCMRGTEVRGDPNERARARGRQGPNVSILHLHGYTPRRFFYITDVKYVFATSQYATAYGADQRPILDSVFEQFLANPLQRAVYLGCSFQDPFMNDLLRRAHAQLPGTEHWAFLQWPGPGRFADASHHLLEESARPYLSFGVRPVWFDDFTDIPALLQQIR